MYTFAIYTCIEFLQPILDILVNSGYASRCRSTDATSVQPESKNVLELTNKMLDNFEPTYLIILIMWLSYRVCVFSDRVEPLLRMFVHTRIAQFGFALTFLLVHKS